MKLKQVCCENFRYPSPVHYHIKLHSVDATLSLESELEEIWTELQDKVSEAVSVLVSKDQRCHIALQCLQVEQLKTEYEKKLSEQRRLLDVSLSRPVHNIDTRPVLH